MVSSWRDEASPQAQEDLDGLLNSALPFAQQMLKEQGGFFPYAVALNESGRQEMIGADPGQGDRPASQDVRAMLIESLRGLRASLRASAVVSDVRSSDTDAVRVELEHRDGHATAVFLPYTKQRLRRGVEYGEVVAGLASPQIWNT